MKTGKITNILDEVLGGEKAEITNAVSFDNLYIKV